MGPNISPDPSPPCSRISGRPEPCVSKYRLMPLTCAYCPVPGAPDAQSVAVTVCSSRPRQWSDAVQTTPSPGTHRLLAGDVAVLGFWQGELASQVADGAGPGGELGVAAEC